MSKPITRLSLILFLFLLCAGLVTSLVLLRAERRIQRNLLFRAQSLADEFSRKLKASFSGIDLKLPSGKRLQLKNELAAKCLSYPNCVAIHLITKKKDGSLIFLTSKGYTRSETISNLNLNHNDIAASINKVFNSGLTVFKELPPSENEGGINIFVPVKGENDSKVAFALCIVVNSRALRKQLLAQGMFPMGLSFILMVAILSAYLVTSRKYTQECPTGKKLLMLLISILGVVLLSALMMYLAHQFLVSKEYRLAKSKTRQVAQKINYIVLYPLKNTTNSIANSELFYRTATGEYERDNEKVLIALQTVQTDYNASLAYILDRNGTVVACTPYENGKTLTGQNYSFRPYFTEAINGNPFIYPALGITTQKRGIYASSPIKGKDTRPVGVFVIKVGLQHIDNILFSAESMMALVSPQGVIFSTNNPDWLLHTVDATPAQVQTLLKTKQFGTSALKPLPKEISFRNKYLRIGNNRYIITRSHVDISNPDGQHWEIIRLTKLGTYTLLVICIGMLTSLVAFFLQLYLVSKLEGKRLQENIALSEKTQRTLIHNLSAAVVIIDSTSRKIETVNPTAAAYLRVSEEEMVGQICHSYLCPFSKEECPVITGKQDVFNQEGIMLRKDGSLMHVIRSIKTLNIKGREKLLHTFVDITELKKTEEALQESEKNFRTLFESIGDMIVVATLEGKILYANPALVDRLGYSIEELSGMHVFDLRPPERRSEAEEACKALFRGEMERCLIPFRAKDGTQIPVDTRVWLGKWNNTQCIFSVSKDISKEQEALHKFEQLFRNNPVMMTLSTIPQLAFADVNNAFLNILGYKKEELIGKSWRHIKIFDPEDCEKFEKLLQKKKTLSNFEMKLKHRDGSSRYGLFSTQYIKIRGHDTVLTVIKDITNLKEAEEHLKVSEERLKSITESAQDAIIMIDPEGIVSFWNPAATSIFGYKKSEAINRPISELIIPPYLQKDHKKAVERFSKSGRGRIFGKILELKARKKDGLEIPVSLSCSPVLIHGRWHAVGILRDITETKKAQARLIKMNTELKQAIARANKMAAKAKAASRAKSIFLANMSHEIRTPLNAILGFAQVLQSDPRFPQDLLDILDIINRSGEHLLALINDILEISKIEAGRVSLKPFTFNLHDLLKDIEIMFKPKAEAKGLNFVIETSDDIPTWIETDRIKLRQVLINLIGNAIKFTSSGYVMVRVSSEKAIDGENQTLLMFRVEDTGPGISSEDLQNLFKPFSQAEEGMKMGGTGLGLSITRGYLKVMGGKISVKSKPGKGSQFSFYVPVKTFEPKTEKTTSEHHKFVMEVRYEDEPPRILVVDDNAGNRKLLGLILERVGFQVRKASNSTKAINLFREWSPHLVFMDIRMPGMDGYETTKRLKSIKPDVPVVAVTANVFGFSKKKFTEAGIDDYVKKPFKQNEIFDVIQRYLDVDYVFSAEIKSSGEVPSTIDVEEMGKLPKQLLSEMQEALEEGDINRLMRLIKQVSSLNHALAQKLKTMAEKYDYDGLAKILTPNIK